MPVCVCCLFLFVCLFIGKKREKRGNKVKKTISCCKYFQVPADSGENVLISSFLHPLTGGLGQDVFSELKRISA